VYNAVSVNLAVRLVRSYTSHSPCIRVKFHVPLVFQISHFSWASIETLRDPVSFRETPCTSWFQSVLVFIYVYWYLLCLYSLYCVFVLYRLFIFILICTTATIATGYMLDGPGIESRWGARFFAHVQTGPGAHPASCIWVPGLSRG
jgi:hypothetical protein